MRVLLIEGDAAAAQAVELMLKAQGMNVLTADDGEYGADLAIHEGYDLILLGDDLPDMTALDALRMIRAAKVASPVIIVSATSDVDMKVRTLDAGADDYLQKPCHKHELVARMRAVIRRSKGHAESKIEFGPVAVHLDSRSISVGETKIHLTAKEYQILELLALHRGATVTKDAVLNHLYNGADEPEIKIVDVFICKVRKKLTDAGAGGYIETVWGRGYRISPTPSFAPLKKTYLRRDRTILDLVLERLAKSRATAKELAEHIPDASEGGLRKAVANGIEQGLLDNMGSAGNAMYRLTEDGRRRVDGGRAAA